MKFKISTFIILFIIINISAILYKAVTINVKNEYRCVTQYEIFITRYNKHIDEIIRGSFSEHALKTLKVPSYDFSLTGSAVYDVWRIKEVKENLSNCNDLKKYVIKHIREIDEKITNDLIEFKNDLIRNNDDPINLKLATIIKSRNSFIQVNEDQIKISEKNSFQSIWFVFLSTLMFFDIIYVFLVFVFFIISKKFSFFKFK